MGSQDGAASGSEAFKVLDVRSGKTVVPKQTKHVITKEAGSVSSDFSLV